MRKKYIYGNAIIYVTIPDDWTGNIQKSTERFLKRVMAEKSQRGEQKYDNNNTSRDFRKKQILD